MIRGIMPIINLMLKAWLDFKIRTSLPMSPYLPEYVVKRAELG